MIFNDLQCLSGATWKCLCVPGFGVEALPSTPLTPPWAISAVADDFDTCSAPASPFYSPAWRVAKSARRCSHPKDPRAVIPLEDLCCESKQHWRVRDALAFTPKALQGDVLVRLLKDTDPGLRESVLLALRRLVPIYWVTWIEDVCLKHIFPWVTSPFGESAKLFFPQKHLGCLGSRLVYCAVGSETEASTSWTERKPWEIAHGESCWEGDTGNRDGSVNIVDGQVTGGSKTEAGSVDIVDGWETVGNRLGRAWLGGSGTSWTGRKPWEMAWGELRWNGARRKRGHRGRTGNRGK